MVSELLQQSLQAHERARVLRNQRRRDEARAALSEARSLRLEALAEDPTKADPAWEAERAPHADMMTFYAQQLGGV